MKKLPAVLTIVILATRLLAQSNAPVRLALIVETDEASAASDVLTVQLSGNPKIQLLERNEIQKVYREQGLSAANKDYLKLGRILGADGLLLFDVVRTPQATNLTARLIAVKPGMVLTDGSFPWPLKDTTLWAESVATYLNSFLPKLALLPKDAIPISVVNLRSAIQSAEAQETERQLKLLTIQRLSQERQFFVLERQKMQLLGKEKELKADESAFWNGSYLLEGVVDQSGYSKGTITINARLTPPKGGAPLLIEVSGSRTNYAEVINRLTVRVTELLKVNSTVEEWNAAAEAQQYYDEAKWALRWGVLAEAQAAADSAWTLGKKDSDCALVRVKSYVTELSVKVGKYQNGESGVQSGQEVNGVLVGHDPPDSEVQSTINYLLAEHPFGMVYETTKRPGAKDIHYVFADNPPDAENIDRAFHALELYYEFSRTSSADLFKVTSETSNWRNSDWYNLGIETLVAISQVLQNFNFVPETQKPVADKLAELRAKIRSVAQWISQAPAVHDSYFVGDRIAVYDELANTIGEDGQRNPNIFSCEAKWGCLWQETPEDGVALYRELMSSAVFSYVHNKFWLRELQTPRLVAWNAEDRKRIPTVWANFIQELNASTNVLWRLEAKALSLADADDEVKTATSFTNLFNSLFENHDALVANPVDVLYLDWGVGALVSAKTGNGISTATKESLYNLYWHEYRSKLEAMDREYRDKTVPARQFLPIFEKQKEYLKENKPFDFQEFVQLFEFGFKDYSKAQALEIQPLVAAYKSNLVAQSQNASGMQKGKLMGAIAQVGFWENDVSRILNPPVVQAPPQARTQTSQPDAVARVVVAPAAPANAPAIVTNVVVVDKFFAIPAETLIHLDSSERIEYLQATITAHHWFEGRLLLDYEYYAGIQWLDEKGKEMGGRNAGGPAIAILDPTTAHWEVINRPKAEIQTKNNFYHRTAIWRSELFTCDGGQIQKYDLRNQQWQVLAVSDGNNYELFVVNEHLYAAGRDLIFEILDGGKSTRILASARRNPPASILDREDLGTPTLFEGPNHALRVCTANKIFTWTGNDWHEDSAAPPASSPPEIFMDGILFRQAGNLNAGYQNGVIYRQPNGVYGVTASQDEISCLANETNMAKFCLGSGNQAVSSGMARTGTKAVQRPKPFWERPANLLPNLPAALRQSDLYLLEDPFAMHAIINERHEIVQENVTVQEGYNAALLCFSEDLLLPQKLFLKFAAPDVKTPTWMFFSTNLLFFGRETPLHIAPTGFSGDGKAGVWQMPISQVETARVAQKQTQSNQMAQAISARKQAQKDLLTKYDRNYNGIIDPDEKEAALDDPAFIESELDTIDANHNGRLDPEELVYFDANRNKILEPKEQAGIEIAQHLLAERLLKKFDANGDGFLDRTEINDLLQSSMETSSRSMPGFSSPFPDDNHDGHVDLGELETFLKQQTRRSLRSRGMPGTDSFNQMRTDASQPVDPRQIFKAAVESYWQNPGSITNRPPFSRRVPLSGGAVTNETQSGTTP